MQSSILPALAGVLDHPRLQLKGLGLYAAVNVATPTSHSFTH
jgi:hypothetical protein